MPTHGPDDLIGRTFLLPEKEKGEHLRVTIKLKIIETSQKLDGMYDKATEQINYLLDIGQGRSQTILSYNQILDHIEQYDQQDIFSS